MEIKDKEKKDAKAAEELRKEKQRFQTDLDNFEKMASKQGEYAQKLAVSNQFHHIYSNPCIYLSFSKSN